MRLGDFLEEPACPQCACFMEKRDMPDAKAVKLICMEDPGHWLILSTEFDPRTLIGQPAPVLVSDLTNPDIVEQITHVLESDGQKREVGYLPPS